MAQKRKPPLPIIPEENPLLVELCSLDHKNYVHIRACDSETKDRYSAIRILLLYENASSLEYPIPLEKIHVGMLVTVKKEEPSMVMYYRAKVLQKQNNEKIICHVIDEGRIVTVSASHVLPISEELTKIPQISLKCRLEGLHFFDDLPILEKAVKLILQSGFEDVKHYQVTILEWRNYIPLIQMRSKTFCLKEKIQQWIRILCATKFPPEMERVRAKMVYANDKGCVWFQLEQDKYLLERIQQKINHPSVMVKFDQTVWDWDPFMTSEDTSDVWKNSFISKPDAVFICASSADKIYYRARITRLMSKEKVEIEFIDYGDKEIVHRDMLRFATHIDESLPFIPPQCIKTRLKGRYRVDVHELWNKTNDIVEVKIVFDDKELDYHGIMVEMYNPGSNEAINYKIANLSMPTAGNRLKVFESYFEKIENACISKPTEEEIYISISDDQGNSVGCQTEESFNLKITEVKKAFQTLNIGVNTEPVIILDKSPPPKHQDSDLDPRLHSEDKQKALESQPASHKMNEEDSKKDSGFGSGDSTFTCNFNDAGNVLLKLLQY